MIGARKVLAVAGVGGALLSGLACAGESGRGASGGTIVISASADADALFPPVVLSVQGKQVTDQIFDNLADIGDSLNTIGDVGFRPRLAKSWSWAPDSSWIDFHLQDSAKWHDGAPVRAKDVAFTFALVKDASLASPLSSNLDDVDSVSTPDSLTARVWLSRHPPDEFFKVASPVPILPSHVLEGTRTADLRASPFASKPIGSGRFRFGEWNRGSRIVLVADSANYRGRPQADRVIWTVANDYNAAALRFVSGAADFLDVVKLEFLSRVAGSGGHVVKTGPGLDYGYVGFNTRRPDGSGPHAVFGDAATRRALVMAVDRASLVKSVFDTLGVVGHGPFTRALFTADTSTDIAFDSAAASHTLDSLGWRRGADGMRARNATPLAFSLMLPSSSAIRMRFAVLLQDQWKRAGAAVKLDPLEVNTFGAQMEGKKFDAMLNAWHIDPDPASFSEEWSTSQTKPGGFNVSSYSNPVFDALADSASREMNPERSAALYRRAYRVLSNDAPAMWLYELRSVFGISKRIEPAGMRPDAWWANLGDWKVLSAK